MTEEQCEALLVTGDGRTYKAGDRCPTKAIATYDGNHVCWLHMCAANNLDRSEPVRFVRQEAAMLRALEEP
jgi:hypothetical protein